MRRSFDIKIETNAQNYKFPSREIYTIIILNSVVQKVSEPDITQIQLKFHEYMAYKPICNINMKKYRRRYADTKRIVMTIDTQAYREVPAYQGLEENKDKINKQISSIKGKNYVASIPLQACKKRISEQQNLEAFKSKRI